MKPKLSQTGFTLIELLIAISIVAVISAIGIASFNNANRRNASNQAAADMQSLLRKLRTDATSGLKPSGSSNCTTAGNTLSGYFFTFQQNSRNYWYGPGCFTGTTWAGPASPTANTLPTGLHFTSAGSYFGGYSANSNTYITIFFPWNGGVNMNGGAVDPSDAGAPHKNSAVYANGLNTVANFAVAYSSGSSEINYLYLNRAGLVCKQRTAPPASLTDPSPICAY